MIHPLAQEKAHHMEVLPMLVAVEPFQMTALLAALGLPQQVWLNHHQLINNLVSLDHVIWVTC